MARWSPWGPETGTTLTGAGEGSHDTHPGTARRRPAVADRAQSGRDLRVPHGHDPVHDLDGAPGGRPHAAPAWSEPGRPLRAAAIPCRWAQAGVQGGHHTGPG